MAFRGHDDRQVREGHRGGRREQAGKALRFEDLRDEGEPHDEQTAVDRLEAQQDGGLHRRCRATT